VFGLTTPIHAPYWVIVSQKENYKPHESDISSIRDSFEFWHAGWYRRHNHSCQILSICFGVMDFWPPNLSLSVGLAGCSYTTRNIWKMLGPFATASSRTPPVLNCRSPGVATVARRLRIDVHNHDNNDNAWQRGPLWPHRMGPTSVSTTVLHCDSRIVISSCNS